MLNPDFSGVIKVSAPAIPSLSRQLHLHRRRLLQHPHHPEGPQQRPLQLQPQLCSGLLKPTEQLMERLKPDMKDHYSIFAQYYMAAGAAAIRYFVSLLNILQHQPLRHPRVRKRSILST